MPEQIIVNVDDPDDLLVGYGAAAKVRLERATTSAFADATEVATATIVSGQSQYEFWDSGGSASSWYRSRYSATGGAPFSEYSDGFQPGAPSTYASLDDLREMLRVPDDSRDNQLVDRLREVTRAINGELGFDLFRHPAVSGTEVRTYDGRHTGRVVEPAGITSVSAVRYADVSGAAYASLTAADWYLRWPVDTGGPYLSLALSDESVLDYWPRGFATIEVTGVFGYERVPDDIRMATLLWAADLYRVGSLGGNQSSAYTGGVSGGLPDFTTGTRFVGDAPTFAWRTIQRYKQAHSLKVH
jgi:hypothetical protein